MGSRRIIEMGSETTYIMVPVEVLKLVFSIDISVELGWTVGGQNEANTFCLRFTILTYYWHKGT
jgi:hypothetical protein